VAQRICGSDREDGVARMSLGPEHANGMMPRRCTLDPRGVEWIYVESMLLGGAAPQTCVARRRRAAPREACKIAGMKELYCGDPVFLRVPGVLLGRVRGHPAGPCHLEVVNEWLARVSAVLQAVEGSESQRGDDGAPADANSDDSQMIALRLFLPTALSLTLRLPLRSCGRWVRWRRWCSAAGLPATGLPRAWSWPPTAACAAVLSPMPCGAAPS